MSSFGWIEHLFQDRDKSPTPDAAVEWDPLPIETVYCPGEGQILLMVTFIWFISVSVEMVMQALFEGAPGTIVSRARTLNYFLIF